MVIGFPADCVGMDAPSFLGGLRASGWGVTWPLVRLTLTDRGPTIAPASRWLNLVLPTYELPWYQVREVQVVTGLFGRRRGVRFILRRRARSARPNLANLWPIPVRRPIVRLRPKDVRSASTLVPPEVPTGRCRGFIIFR
jgi:hypothetical protein